MMIGKYRYTTVINSRSASCCILWLVMVYEIGAFLGSSEHVYRVDFLVYE